MSMEIKFNEDRKREYRKMGYWGDATLADYWQTTVLKVPEKVAVIDLQGSIYTYAELDDAAGRVATFLKKAGVVPGDIVSVQLPGWSEFTVIYVACLKIGAVINPICTRFRADELLYILNKCETKILFIPSEFKNYDYAEMLKSISTKIPSLMKVVVVEKEKKVVNGITLEKVIREHSPLECNSKCSSDDLAAVMVTSGTESFPKCVMLTHNNIISSEKSFAASININYLDIMLMPAPVTHATGFHHGVTLPFMLGAKSVLQDIFNSDTSLSLIENEKCTVSMGSTPFVYDILIALKKKKYNISSLRFFICGGAPIPRHMVKDSLKAGIKIIGCYGATESVPHTVVRPDDPIERVLSTDGLVVPGTEIRVVDEKRRPVPVGVEGEEASRGPNVFMGYLKEPELTSHVLDEDGWYYGGDLCIIDNNGYIKITGRKKDIIIRGGENVSCNEIEELLLQHPNVRETGVVGMFDERLGERVCAYVVLNNPNEGLTLEDIKAFLCKKNVCKGKHPERIEIVKSLPRTMSGKVQKFILRKFIKDKLEEEKKTISILPILISK